MLPANEALQRLRDGNARFAAGEARRPTDLVQEQDPCAVVLGCSDARVPPEIVFDQGPGDLFVVRVAGNIVARSQVGSVEFAVERFGTRLVVVLGHTRCGAVMATMDGLRTPAGGQSPNLLSIVERVRPSVEGLIDTVPDDQLVTEAVRANIRASVEHLSSGSPLIERLVREDGLVVVGAQYSIETGVVEFFD